jgi:amino acid transporter
MFAAFVIVWVGIIAWLIDMAVSGNGHFNSAFNAHSGGTVSGVIASANHAGFSAAGGIGWGATLFGMIYCFQVFTGFQWTGYFAGEIRNVRRTATTSIIGALLISAIGYVVATALIYKYYGFNFFGSAVFGAFGGGKWTLGFQPYLPALISFLPGPQWLLVFMSLCFLLAIVWWTPTGFMMGTRNMFAWSFDRLAPERLTQVSDRFHTPVLATIVIGVIVEILNYFNIYQGLGSFLLNALVVMGVAFIIVSLAAAVVPWRRPGMHEQAPGWAKASLAGVPVITVVAAISAISWGFVIYVALHTGIGSVGWKPMIEAFSVPAAGIVYYIGVRLVRRAQGMQLSQAFAEIPPE